MKIGILGGTFDPIHNGHIYIANEAKKMLELDKIVFIVNGNPPHKNTVFGSDSDRLNMLKLATENNKDFIVDEIELKENHSYTYETLEYLKVKYPFSELVFIAGADNITEIPKWKNPQRIFEIAAVAFLVRPPYEIENEDISFLKSAYNANIFVLNIKGIEISSSYIREKIRINSVDKIAELLPSSVCNYIKSKEIYK